MSVSSCLTTAHASFLDGRVALHAGDCLDVLRALADASLDACVTDPPYHLTSIVKRFGAADAAPCRGGDSPGQTGVYARGSRGFMGQTWDGGDIAFRPELWREVWRVLKPGAHLVAFSGTRTYHRMACAIEDAGFEMRDMVLDLLASDTHVAAFLETLDAAQRAAFARCLDESGFGGMLAWIYGSGFPKSHDVAKGIDKAAGLWRGRAKGAKGANVAMAGPNYERTPKGDAVTDDAITWEGWGTALKPALEPVCLARKPLSGGTVAANVLRWGTGALNVHACRVGGGVARKMAGDQGRCGSQSIGAFRVTPAYVTTEGNWPANLLLDGSAETAGLFPLDDEGSKARFFYSAKADADDRLGSKHPTVKPVDLMAWLCRLVTPPGGTVLDPFAGTGTTGEAAWREGFSAVLIEREAAYRDDIARRMALCLAGPATRRAAAHKARAADRPADHGPLFGTAAEPVP